MALIHHSHDHFLKLSLKEKQVARDFFKAHLAPELYQKLDVNTLQTIDKSYVTPKLREIHSDLVFTCQIEGNVSYLPIIFLVEHQSTPNEHMAFRLLQYTVGLMDDHIKAGNKTLPLVLPLCVYHGKQSPYPFSQDIYDAFEAPDLARTRVFKPFCLIDLTILSVEQLKQHGVAALMEIVLKQTFKKEFSQTMKQLAEEGVLRQAISQTTEPYLISVLDYILAQGDEHPQSSADEIIHIFKEALPEKRGVIMTFADQLRQQGVQQGLQAGLLQGKLEGMKASKADVWKASKLEAARNMQAAGLDAEFIKKMTGLDDVDLVPLISEDEA